MAAVGARAPLAESSFESNLQVSNDVALLLYLPISLSLSLSFLIYPPPLVFRIGEYLWSETEDQTGIEKWNNTLRGKGVCEFELEIKLIVEQV